MTDPDPPTPTDLLGDVPAPKPRVPLGRLRTTMGYYRVAIKGLGWTGLSQVLAIVIRFGSNLTLTRLLVPEVYGVFSVALAVIGTLEFLSDFGVQPALIRNPEGSTRRYLLTGWCIGNSRGAVLSSLVLLLAYPVSWFERQPMLFPVLCVLAIRPLLHSLRSPGVPNLRRTLNYRAIFLMDVTDLVATTAVSIVVAYLTHSIWSIVAGTITGMCVSLAVSYIVAPVRPAWLWDREVVAQVAGLGRQILINTMAMALWLNLDRLLGARYLGGRQMGFYAVAMGLASNIEMLIVRGCDVYFSMLSRRADLDARRAWNRKVCLALSVAAMPGLALVVAAAPTIIGVLYRPEWAPAKLLFGILTARVMIRGLGQIQYEYLLSTGNIRINTGAYFAAAATQAVILVPLVTARGVNGLAWASLGSALVYVAAQTIPMKLRGDAAILPLAVTCGWAALGLGALLLQVS